MTRPAFTLLCLLLASCATVPRAIIPPPSEIAELDVAPVAEAGRVTRDAVRGVADAGAASREAERNVSASTRRLTDSLARAEALAAAHAEITAALADTRRLAAELEASVSELSATLAFAEERERMAILAVDDMGAIIDRLQADTAAQATQIRAAKSTEETLRTQVQALAESADKRIIAEDKLRWWRWYGVAATAFSAALILLLIYRPRIPFLT